MNRSGVFALGLAVTATASTPAFAADPVQPAAQANPSVHVWAGASYAPGSIYGYLGGVIPLNGDLYADGVQFRIEGGIGRYDYDGAGPYRDISVDQRQVDLLAGYHFNLGKSAISVFAGLNYQDHDNPDPAADVRGSKAGLKVQGEIYQPFTTRVFGYALASYSTAFDTYYASGKVAYRFSDRFSLGPEVTFLGNEDFDQVRVGATAGIGVFEIGEIIVGVGNSWDENGGRDGLYANVHLRAAF